MPTKLCMHRGVCFSMSAYDTPCGSRYTALCARPASGGGFVCCEQVDRSPYAGARIITQRVGDDVAAVVATTNGRVLDMAVSSDGTSAVHTCVDGVCLRSMEGGQVLHAIDYGAWEPRRVSFCSPAELLVVGGGRGCAVWDVRCRPDVCAMRVSSRGTATCAAVRDRMLYVGADKRFGLIAYDMRVGRAHPVCGALSTTGRAVLDVATTPMHTAILWANGIVDLCTHSLVRDLEFSATVTQSANKFMHRLVVGRDMLACTAVGAVLVVPHPGRCKTGVGCSWDMGDCEVAGAVWMGESELMCMHGATGDCIVTGFDEVISY